MTTPQSRFCFSFLNEKKKSQDNFSYHIQTPHDVFLSYLNCKFCYFFLKLFQNIFFSAPKKVCSFFPVEWEPSVMWNCGGVLFSHFVIIIIEEIKLLFFSLTPVKFYKKFEVNISGQIKNVRKENFFVRQSN